MEKRKKIVKELKALKEKGFDIQISSNSNMASAGMTINSGTVHLVAQPMLSSAIERVKSKMVININAGDSEDTILERIATAKEVLKEYDAMIEHEKSTPDLIDYIRNNVFLD